MLAGLPAGADALRIASFHTQLTREGPGLLLRDILRGGDGQVAASVAVIAAAGADVLVLQEVDFDADGLALAALADAVEAAGLSYPYRLALRPNTGRPTGVDIDGDGRSWRARDAQGYGHFNGQGGWRCCRAIPSERCGISRISCGGDLPGSAAPAVLPQAALPVLRLASVAAWDVAVEAPGGPLHLLALHATPPVFDGPEDRNGWRNADELRFWAMYLDGWSPGGLPFAARDFAVIGTLNVDPSRGEGRREGLGALLDHSRLQDVVPRRPGGGMETADWPDPVPGDLRVDYILPAARLTVTGAGVLWPEGEEGVLPASVAAMASDHRLVWIDLAWPPE